MIAEQCLPPGLGHGRFHRHFFSQLPLRDLNNTLESEQSIRMAVFTSTDHQDCKFTLSFTFRIWSIKQSPSGWRILYFPVYTARHHLIFTGSQHCKMWAGRGRPVGYPTAVCSRTGLGFLPPRFSTSLFGYGGYSSNFSNSRSLSCAF